MTTNDLTSLFEDKDTLDFLPAEMVLCTLQSIGVKLAKWKRGELDENERLDIEKFAYMWLTRILNSQNSPLAEKFAAADSDYLLLLLAMGELESMVHHELVSRALQCWTYPPMGIIEVGRLKLTNLDFLRCHLRFKGLGVLAEGYLISTLSFISKFLEQ